MSEPQTPPPAPPPVQPEKKGLSPIAWILIGCLGFLLLVVLAMGACGLFVAKKASEFGEDFRENPARTMAEIAVRANPDLELVDTDEDAETITVRNTRTGEEMTLDWSDFGEEGFTIRTEEGEIGFGAPDGEDAGTVTMRDSEGEVTQIFGAGDGDDIPDLPMPPGSSEPEGIFRTQQGEQESGAFRFTTDQSVAQVLDFYERELTGLGYEVSKSTYSSGGASGGSVGGRANGDSVSVIVGEENGVTSVNVTYSSGG